MLVTWTSNTTALQVNIQILIWSININMIQDQVTGQLCMLINTKRPTYDNYDKFDISNKLQVNSTFMY